MLSATAIVLVAAFFTREANCGGTSQPAEIVGLRIRAPANAFSTASNWTFNFMVVMVTGPAFNNIGWKTYIGMLS